MDPDDFDVYDEIDRVYDEYDSDMEVFGTEVSFGTDEFRVPFDGEQDSIKNPR